MSASRRKDKTPSHGSGNGAGTPKLRNSAAPVRKPGAPSESHRLALGVLVTAVAMACVGGGMLGDRVSLGPLTSPLEVVGWPAALLLISLALVLAMRETDSPQQTGQATLIWGLFAAVCSATFAVSAHRYQTLTGLAILFGSLCAGWAAKRVVRASEDAGILVLGLIGTAGAISLNGLVEFVLRWTQNIHFWRVFSTFVNPDFLAGFLILTATVTLAAFLAARKQWAIIVCGGLMAVQTLCLLLTQSRLGLGVFALSLIALAVCVRLSGGLPSVALPRAKWLLAGCAVIVVAGAPGVARRLQGSGTDSHSADFRYYTWRNSQQMALARPILGSGFGAFEAAYPRYAELGYTQHAHNSYVQLAAEAGIPATLLLLTGLAASLAAMAAPLKRRKQLIVMAEGVGAVPLQSPFRDEEETLPNELFDLRLLCCGLVAGAAGHLAHNLFDSDLYIPANSVALAVATGIGMGAAPILQARVQDVDEATSKSPARFTKCGAPLAYTAIAFLCFWGTVTAIGRNRLLEAQSSKEDRNSIEQSFRQAATLLWPDAESALNLASFMSQTGRVSEAEKWYREAIHRADVGKTRYRFGKFLVAQKRNEAAIPEFEAARKADPHNLPNLLALAEAHIATGHSVEAQQVYQAMADLYDRPFDRIRAMPELINWEIGEAMVRLAESKAGSDPAQQRELLENGSKVLDSFWRTRNNELVQQRMRPDLLIRAAKSLQQALDALTAIDKAAGKSAEAQARVARREELTKELETFTVEAEKRQSRD